jgi:hypothetical protein
MNHDCDRKNSPDVIFRLFCETVIRPIMPVRSLNTITYFNVRETNSNSIGNNLYFDNYLNLSYNFIDIGDLG